jgi:hypothetical protein
MLPIPWVNFLRGTSSYHIAPDRDSFLQLMNCRTTLRGLEKRSAHVDGERAHIVLGTAPEEPKLPAETSIRCFAAQPRSRL